MLEQLNDLILRLNNWGYVIVFVIVMLECQAFLGFFMPGESMVMVAGFLAGQDVLDVRVLIVVVAVAAIVGDSIGYEFGRRLGRDWLRRHGEKFWLRPERLDKMDVFFTGYGGWSVLFAHFLHVGRALMPFMAGAARLPYLRFLSFNAIGCILWATIYSLLGYLFGQSWHLIDRWIGRAGVIGAILSTMVVVTIVLWRGIASRELEIREWWRQFCARPAVVSLRLRFCAADRLARATLFARVTREFISRSEFSSSSPRPRSLAGCCSKSGRGIGLWWRIFGSRNGSPIARTER